jgi:NADH:ubiquinone oxidoreductase subunit K
MQTKGTQLLLFAILLALIAIGLNSTLTDGKNFSFALLIVAAVAGLIGFLTKPSGS